MDSPAERAAKLVREKAVADGLALSLIPEVHPEVWRHVVGLVDADEE